MWFWRIHFTWSDLVLAIVQLPWMLMANQNLLQKHATNFIYAINLNETGYIRLFFLTEKIYEKNCFRKVLFLPIFLWQNTEKSPKLRLIAHNKCIEVILPGFFSSSLSHNWVISVRSKALKLNKSTHQYVAMATAEPISIFCASFGSTCLYMTTTCLYIKFGRIFFRVSYLLKRFPPTEWNPNTYILLAFDSMIRPVLQFGEHISWKFHLSSYLGRRSSKQVFYAKSYRSKCIKWFLVLTQK